MTSIQKLTSYLVDHGYTNALRALDFAQLFHRGVRRDGDTEISHPVTVALQIIQSGKHFIDPEETIICALLHDTTEDYDVGFDTIQDMFGAKVSYSTYTVTKTHRGITWPFADKMQEAALDPIGSIVKSSDRLHNLKTIRGAFTPRKTNIYLTETTVDVIPPLRTHQHLHGRQSSSISFFLSEIESLVQQTHFNNALRETA